MLKISNEYWNRVKQSDFYLCIYVDDKVVNFQNLVFALAN